jgi:hypothetical protein
VAHPWGFIDKGAGAIVRCLSIVRISFSLIGPAKRGIGRPEPAGQRADADDQE